MNASKKSQSLYIIIGVIIWIIVIATPQYVNHYSVGLLSGELEIGEIPVEFYLGIIGGVVMTGIVYAVSHLIALLLNKMIKPKSIKTIVPFMVISLLMLALTISAYSEDVSVLINTDEETLNELRNRINKKIQ